MSWKLTTRDSLPTSKQIVIVTDPNLSGKRKDVNNLWLHSNWDNRPLVAFRTVSASGTRKHFIKDEWCHAVGTKWDNKRQEYFRHYEKKDNDRNTDDDDTSTPRSFEIQSRLRDEDDETPEKQSCLQKAANAAGKAKAAVASAYATASCQSKESKEKKAKKQAFDPNDLNLRRVYTFKESYLPHTHTMLVGTPLRLSATLHG